MSTTKSSLKIYGKDCSQKVISSVCHGLDKYDFFNVHTNNEILEILTGSEKQST